MARPPFSEDTASTAEILAELRRFLRVECGIHADVVAPVVQTLGRCPWVAHAVMGAGRRLYGLEQFFSYLGHGLEPVAAERDALRGRLAAAEAECATLREQVAAAAREAEELVKPGG